MLESLARLAHFFVCEREIVMRVGVGGGQLDRHFVGLNRFLDASGFIENVAQIEISKSVPGIGLYGAAVVLFCQREILAIVVKRSKIDVSCGVRRFELKNALVSFHRFGLRGRIVFQRDTPRE